MKIYNLKEKKIFFIQYWKVTTVWLKILININFCSNIKYVNKPNEESKLYQLNIQIKSQFYYIKLTH